MCIRDSLQIIFFGREHCPARHHDLTLCPICSWAATKKRVTEEARMNRPKAKTKPKTEPKTKPKG